MDFRFAKGDRVSVADTYHWAQDALGTIDEPPEQVAALAEGWQGVAPEEALGKPSFWRHF